MSVGKHGRKRLERAARREKWYYDACALTRNVVLDQIINARIPHEALISHLALGEAVGGELKTSVENATVLLQLINDMREYITVIGNDHAERELSAVCDAFPRISTTDALHLATALSHGCCIFRTTDQDIKGNAAKLKKFASENYGKSFAVVSVA